MGKLNTLLNFVKIFFQNKKALIGSIIFLFFVFIAIFAPLIAPYSPQEMGLAPLQKPNNQHLFGTTIFGEDIFSMVVWGTRTTLFVGLVTGLITTTIAVTIGLVSGYMGGKTDSVLMAIANIFLVIPNLPLMIIIASFVVIKGVGLIIFVIAITGWAWGSRVLRSQTLSLKNRDYVKASVIVGESNAHIIFSDIFPNMLSLIVANYFNAALFAILSEAGLEFLGLGDVNVVSWGTILYWAQNSNAMLYGSWPWILVPGICISLLGSSFALMNFAVDELTNPKLRR